MRFNDLRSIAHNVADSLASGMMGHTYHGVDIFGEAERSPEQYIDVDFLQGSTTAKHLPRWMAEVIASYGEALPDLCKRHGGEATVFRKLTARYSGSPEHRVTIWVEDHAGRRAADEYEGLSLRRPRQLDALGRIRRSPGVVSRPDEADTNGA